MKSENNLSKISGSEGPDVDAESQEGQHNVAEKRAPSAGLTLKQAALIYFGCLAILISGLVAMGYAT